MSAGDKYFQGNPIRLDVSRSKFPLNHNWRGTFNAGRWIPFYTQEVLAGDTFKIDANVLLRSTKPVAPVMDNATVSVEFFYVPFDLILSRSYMTPSTTDSNASWRAFFGAQDSLLNMPLPSSDPTLPVFYNVTRTNSSPYLTGGLLDCLGIPPAQSSGTNVSYRFNALKVLSYYAVWNEFLRDPNVMSPATFSINSSTGEVTFTVNSDLGIAIGKGNHPWEWSCAPSCANHGYFGSALPWPQRNSTSVTLPLGSLAPVITGNEQSYTASDWVGKTPLMLRDVANGSTEDSLALGLDSGSLAVTGTPVGTGNGQVPSNLYADLENATAASINTLRAAFATQRWYEQLARSGNRYDEMIQGMFGVTPPSKGVKPEYLGGKDIPLGIQQVNGTASDNLGTTGALSETFDRGHYCTKSFTEPGLIIGLMTVRTADSFAQGLDAFDMKFNRFDFYWPQFANVGEVGIPKAQLYVEGSTTGALSSDDQSIFGYQEYAADYRYHPDVVTGYFRPDASGSLAYWTYVNNFSTHPTLKDFLQGGDRFKGNVDQTLTTKSVTAGFQFYGMVHMDVTAVRPMPLHSIPGLIDHH